MCGDPEDLPAFKVWGRCAMRYAVLLILLASVAFSCSDFAYQESESDQTRVSVKFEGVRDVGTFTVLAGRLVNSLHYVWSADSVMSVRVGEYYAVAFSQTDSVYVMDGLDEFRNDPSVSMKDIYVSLPELPEEEQHGISDHNPYAPFVGQASKPLYFDFRKFSAQDSVATVSFSPKDMTQHLTFRLNVKAANGVMITGVKASLTGVAGRVRLMSGLVRNDVENPTYKQYVEMERVSGSVYEGSVRVLGLFPSESEKYKAGPGILHLDVHASVMDDDYMHERIFHAGINLKTFIEEAGLMEKAEDGSGFRITRNRAVIDIPALLEVSRDKVVSGAGDGFEQWFVHEEKIEVDV